MDIHVHTFSITISNLLCAINPAVNPFPVQFNLSSQLSLTELAQYQAVDVRYYFYDVLTSKYETRLTQKFDALPKSDFFSTDT